MNVGNIQLSVQRQLKDDWDNREYVQLISDNVKNIADFLTQFEVSCKGKLAELDDRITNIERKLDFLEALV
ncbi:hypothetical protein FO519_000412 [Halicephalobus sp. NKZ332]|nr:hypothetical protein FO519_000412 [Halicephalobus sp. NKZ332]